MKVLKFGGTSVGSLESLRNVLEIIKNQAAKKEETLLVVVSAFGKTTDKLEILAREAMEKEEGFSKEMFTELENDHFALVEALIPITDRSGIISYLKQEFNRLEETLEGVALVGELSDRVLAKILGYGELLSSTVIQSALKVEGVSVCRKDSRELIKTDDVYLCAEVNFEETRTCLQSYFSSDKERVVILPGFISSTKEGVPTCLGRGGSDYTASIVASEGNAESLEIWTDVDGVYTSDPRVVVDAIPVEKMSYKEAMEMAYFGAKIIYTPTIRPLMQKKIPLYIKNTFNPEAKGTEVGDFQLQEERPITGITYVDDVSVLNLCGSSISNFSSFSERLFGLLKKSSIPVLLVVHASSTYSISMAIQTRDADRTKKIIDKHFKIEIENEELNPVELENDLNIVALIGSGMKDRKGTTGKMFGVFEKENVNVRAVAQDAFESNISAVISKEDIRVTLNSLHEVFFPKKLK